MDDHIDGVNVRNPVIAWHEQAFALAKWAWDRLANRLDAWGEYRPPEEVGKPWEKDGRRGMLGEQKTAKGKLTQARLMRHFRATGRTDVLGLHTADANNLSKGGALDIDHHVEGEPAPEANLRAALGWYGVLAQLRFRPLLYESNGKGGYHLRVLLSEAIDAGRLFWFLKLLTADHAHHGLPKRPEQFPKQSDVRKCRGGYGNWLRAPGRHHKRDFWSKVYDGSSWLEGAAAVAHILSLPGDPPELVPEVEESRVRLYPAGMPSLAEGDGRDNAAYNFACFLARDLSIGDGMALGWLERWDAGNSPSLGTDRLREILANAHSYGQHAYGAGLNGGPPTPPPAPPTDNGTTADAGKAPAAAGHLTDLGNAGRLVTLRGADLRHCWPWHAWVTWSGTRWHDDDTGAATRAAKAVPAFLYRHAVAEINSLRENAEGGGS
jgi:hypothetical protein